MVNRTISTRLVAALIALVMTVVAAATVLSIRREQVSFRGELELQAELVLDSLTVTSFSG